MLRGIGLLALGLALVAPVTSVAAADLPVKAVPYVAAPGPWLDTYAGATVDQPGWYAYGGAIGAFNGNLHTSGWLWRAQIGGGHYDYNQNSTTQRKVDYENGDLMIGYQQYFGLTRVSLYAGGNVEHHDNQDPFADVKGTRGGFKTHFEVFSSFAPGWYGLFLANYSTAFNNYFAMVKVGYKINDWIAIGPEVAKLGNERYDAIRTGPFVSFDINKSTLFIISGGYSWDERKNTFNDHSGAYGAVHLRHTF